MTGRATRCAARRNLAGCNSPVRANKSANASGESRSRSSANTATCASVAVPAANASATPGSDPSNSATAIVVRRCASCGDTHAPNIASGARPRRTNSANTSIWPESTRQRSRSVAGNAATSSASDHKSSPPASIRSNTPLGNICSIIRKGCDSERNTAARAHRPAPHPGRRPAPAPRPPPAPAHPGPGPPGPAAAAPATPHEVAQLPSTARSRSVASRRVGDGDQCPRPLTQRAPAQFGDAVFGDHVIDRVLVGGHHRPGRQPADDRDIPSWVIECNTTNAIRARSTSRPARSRLARRCPTSTARQWFRMRTDR